MDKRTIDRSFLRFGVFELDLFTGEIRKGGLLLNLPPQPFKILALLATRHGQLVSREEIRQQIWGSETFVDFEQGLNFAISRIRTVLGDNAESPRYVETLPRRGYRFVAQVEIVAQEQPNQAAAHCVAGIPGNIEPVKQVDISVLESVQESDESQKESADCSAQRKYWSQHSPFRGLRVFEPEDSWLFFGRDSDTEELLSRLSRSPVLAIIGNSGSGKSSLVRAGLIPALQQADSWRIALFRPSSSPFDYLAEVLPSQLMPELSLREQSEFIADCRNKFPAREDALRNAIATLANAKSEKPRCTRILLVADQFEELFTLTPSQKLRDQYIDALLAASHLDGAIPVQLVITVRADFYSHCLKHAGLSRCLEANLYNVRQMIPLQLRESIEKRLALASVGTESGLIDALLEDVGSEPGNLALLEHALGQLWEQCGGFGGTVTYRAYADIGRLSGALGRHANNVYQGLADNKHKRLARRIFLEVVHLGEGAHDTRRRVLKEDLLSFADPEEVDQVLALLASSRLITTGREGDQTFVEVSHEMLIQEWDLLREWIREDREELQLQRRLQQAADEWQRLNREAAALLRGARLAQGEEWLLRHPETQALLGEFLQASITARFEAERKEREAREWEREQQLERQRQAEKLRLRRVIAGFFMFSIVLGVIFTWRYIETNVKARRDQLVREYEKTITELERSLKEMQGQTDEAQKQATESHRRADDAQSLLQKEHEKQTKQSQDMEALQTLADKQRTEVLHLKKILAETENNLADEKIKATSEKTEITKLKQDNQILQRQIEESKDISNSIKSKSNPSEVDQTKIAGSPPLKPVSLDVVVFNDKANSFVSGLEKKSFRVFEDNIEQSLTQFSAVTTPWSIGIVLDMSHDVDDLKSLHKATTAFVKTLPKDDEFFVVGSSVAGNKDHPRVYQQFRSVESFENNADPLEPLVSVTPKKRHVLLDAVSVALDEMRNAKHLHQAILVFSVGWTDNSRHSEREILEAVRKNNVQIYAISVPGPDIPSLGSIGSISIQDAVNDMTKQSGGHLFNIPLRELTNASTNIVARLHSLYVLEYLPQNQQRNGGYRRISVKLISPHRHVGLDYRQGYYAKAQ